MMPVPTDENFSALDIPDDEFLNPQGGEDEALLASGAFDGYPDDDGDDDDDLEPMDSPPEMMAAAPPVKTRRPLKVDVKINRR